jgi:hypothetical protein
MTHNCHWRSLSLIVLVLATIIPVASSVHAQRIESLRYGVTRSSLSSRALTVDDTAGQSIRSAQRCEPDPLWAHLVGFSAAGALFGFALSRVLHPPVRTKVIAGGAVAGFVLALFVNPPPPGCEMQPSGG